MLRTPIVIGSVLTGEGKFCASGPQMTKAMLREMMATPSVAITTLIGGACRSRNGRKMQRCTTTPTRPTATMAMSSAGVKPKCSTCNKVKPIYAPSMTMSPCDQFRTPDEA